MGTRFSDNNSGKSQRVAHRRLYADIPMNLLIHPNTEDLTVLKDIDAVKQAVKNLILTNFVERPFNPNLGSNVTALLFENADPFTKLSIQEEILKVLDKYGPRVSVSCRCN